MFTAYVVVSVLLALYMAVSATADFAPLSRSSSPWPRRACRYHGCPGSACSK